MVWFLKKHIFKKTAQNIGILGENTAVHFLKKHGFSIITRNYRKKWGEIDIIAEKDNILHFVEVKALSYILKNNSDYYEAEEKVDRKKKYKLRQIIDTYLSDEDVPEDMDYVVDIIAVYIEPEKNIKIRFIEDVNL